MISGEGRRAVSGKMKAFYHENGNRVLGPIHPSRSFRDGKQARGTLRPEKTSRSGSKGKGKKILSCFAAGRYRRVESDGGDASDPEENRAGRGEGQRRTKETIPGSAAGNC